MSTKWKVFKEIISAEKLCRFADISKIKKEKKRTQHTSHSDFLFEEKKYLFSKSEFLEDDFEILLRKIIDAAKDGKYEVEVMSFPAAYCTDGGRAINCLDKKWTETLVGKARSFYVIWKEHGQPKGYRLKAMIKDFPGGFYGDVSLLINWS